MHGNAEKMDIFWGHGDNSMKDKIMVYNAVIRAKLVYGLESIQLTESAKSRLDVFQLKGLRKILKETATYIDRARTNAYIYRRASEAMSDGANIWVDIKKLSDYYDDLRITRFAKIITAGRGDPMYDVAFPAQGLHMHYYGKLRIGRPRLNLIRETRDIF